MKTSIASTLSVAGVVAAGVAAFALNTAVLTTGAADTGAAASPTTVAPVATIGGGGAAQAAAAAPAAPVTAGSTQVSATVTTYRVGEAGSVVVDTAGGLLAVRNILPATGWTSEPATTEPDGTVKVHFVKGPARLEFVARMVSGAVDVQVRNETPTATIAPPRRENHDDDDEHEDEERDDEEHEDDEREEHEDDDHHGWEDDDD